MLCMALASPWRISSAATDEKSEEVSLHVSCTVELTLKGPKCNQNYSVYNRRGTPRNAHVQFLTVHGSRVPVSFGVAEFSR